MDINQFFFQDIFHSLEKKRKSMERLNVVRDFMEMKNVETSR